MANTDAPNGFRPWSNPNNGSGQPVVRYLDLSASNTQIDKGDPVTSASGVINVAAASDALIGIAAESKAASTGGKIAIWSDPDQEFVAQTDDGTGTATAIGGAQANINFVAGTGSNGRSIS